MVEVPLTWQLAKLGLSISMVLGLGTIAVRASPRVAGLLSGYPLGTALALFFHRLRDITHLCHPKRGAHAGRVYRHHGAGSGLFTDRPTIWR